MSAGIRPVRGVLLQVVSTWTRGVSRVVAVVAEDLRAARTFVGRDQELRLLRGLVETAATGGCAAVVLGEPGVGKTTLLREATAAVQRTLWVAGVESEAMLAFAAVADLMRPFRKRLDQLPPAQRDALAVALAMQPGTPPSLLAVCAGVLGVIAAAGDDDPLLIVVDDYQWMDPSSRQVLSFVARRLTAAHVVMLFALRAELREPAVRLDLPTVRLGGLTPDECRVMISALNPDLPASVLSEIIARTGGNPLAVLEAVGGTSAAGGLQGRSPGHSLERAMSAVVDDLPAPTLIALFVLAAASRPLPLGQVEAVLGELGCTLADLEPAESGKLIRTTPTLALRHPLLQPVVIERTPLATRLAVFKALALHPDPDLRVWYRAAAATGPDDAVADGLAAAALQARGRSGHLESARAWQRAAALTTDAGSRAERLLSAATDAQTAGACELALMLCDEAGMLCRQPSFVADLELVRGRANVWQGRLQHAATDLVRAADAVREHDAARAARLYAEAAVPLAIANRHHDMLAVAMRSEALESGGQRSLQSVAMTAAALTLRGECAQARQRLELGARLTRDSDPTWNLQFVTLLANCRVWLEDFDIAQAQLGRVLGQARRAAAPSVLALALTARGELDMWTGQWSDAYADATEALHWSEELGQVTSLGQALLVLARLDAARGETTLCHERLDRARHGAAARGIDCLSVSLPAVAGFAALGSGRFDKAADHLEAAWTAAVRAGMRCPTAVPFGGDLVEAHVHTGDRVRAAAALHWLEGCAEATGLIQPAATAARCQGMLAAGPAAADASFGKAKALLERCAMPFERARTLLCEAETMRRMRRPTPARRLLREALGVFDGLGARPWMARAERELAATGVQPGSGRTGCAPDTLTPQEFQIARAVAGGLSNAEAAAALFLSRKTIEAHLTRVYRKLGLRSRTELARTFPREPLSSA